VSSCESFGIPIIEVAGKGACLVDPYDVASIRQGRDGFHG
jgi:hypothetical protein